MSKFYAGTNFKNMYYFLIIYDISDDRRRGKIAKLLEGYGKRVQYSAFECCLSKKQYSKLEKEIKSKINEEDNIRFYKLRLQDELKTGIVAKDDDIFCDLIVF